VGGGQADTARVIPRPTPRLGGQLAPLLAGGVVEGLAHRPARAMMRVRGVWTAKLAAFLVGAWPAAPP